MYDYYDYNVPSTTGSAAGVFGGLAVGMIIVLCIIFVAVAVFMIIAEVKLYKPSIGFHRLCTMPTSV